MKMKNKIAALALVLCFLMAAGALASVICMACQGTGQVTCSACGGSGRITRGTPRTGYVTSICGTCHGTGRVTCRVCGGDGRVGSEGGEGGEGGEEEPAEPTISQTSLTLIAGRKATLTVNDATDDVSWSTSNRSVATVSSGGVVKAVKAGKATITAKTGGKELHCSVTVTKKIYARSIKLKKPSGKLLVGESLALSYTISPDPSKITESYSVSWSSSNKKVAVVDKTGTVRALRAGSTTITAKLRIKSGQYREAKCTVDVETGLQRFKDWFRKNSHAISGGRMYRESDTLSITYKTAARTWTFKYDDGESCTTYTFGENFKGIARLSFSFTGRFTGLRVVATSKARVSSITRDSGYTWVFQEGGGYGHARMADASAHVVLSSMQCVFSDKMSMEWKDVGLTAY